MLLRRIMRHVQNQNWFAVGLDFIIVVVGVLLALQVSNWNDARRETRQAEQFLERLELDFSQQFEQTKRSLDYHQQYLAAANRLIDGVRSGSFNEASLLQDMYDATAISTPPGPSTAFQELVSSGRTDLIRDEELRRRLYAYNSYVSFVRDRYDYIVEPLLDTRSVLMPARTLLTTGVPSKGYEDFGSTQQVDTAVLVSQPGVLEALQLAYLSQDNAYLVILQIQERIEAIQALIEAEQDNQEAASLPK